MTTPTPKSRTKIKNRLAELRAARQLTQTQVARFMQLDVTTICKQEAGERRLSNEQAKLYAELYQCTILDIYIDSREVLDSGS